MSALLSGLLSGGWPFLVGWVFPSALSFAVFTLLARSGAEEVAVLEDLAELSTAAEAVVLPAVALALGLLLSALQAPLYRILEGYYLPRSMKRKWAKRQLDKRQVDQDELDRLRAEETERPDPAPGVSIRRGLLAERLRRYPKEAKEVAPTRLANAIRAFETYGWHRFRLDSQLLWPDLLSVAPEQARHEQERARAGVDFFVSLVYLCALFGLLMLMLGITQTSRLLVVAGGCHLVLVPLWYRLAVITTDNWYLSVQALVDLGRKPLAESLNLSLPQNIEDEREMWHTVCGLVQNEYNPRRSEFLKRFAVGATRQESTATRAEREDAGTAGATSSSELPPHGKVESRSGL